MATEQPSYTWILLRGLSRESGHWGPFLESFAAAFPRDQILALDLPGTGQFCDSPSPFSMSEIFQRVRAEAVERAPSQNQFKLMAISLGGMVAMEWMRQRPEDLASCVLINSSSRAVSPFYLRLRWQIWRDFARILTIQAVRERERQVIALLMNNPEAQEAALPLWSKIAAERPISYITFANQLLAASRFSGLQENPRVPTLLVSGLGDRLVDPACSTALSKQMNWSLVRHPWAGHDLPWDDGRWLIDKVVEWDTSLTNAKH